MARVTPLAAALALLAALLVYVWANDRSGHKAPQRGIHDPVALATFESLLRPKLSQAEILRRAKTLLAEAGAPTEGVYFGLRLTVDDAYPALARHPAAEVAAFAARGAPLVRWDLYPFRVHEWLERREDWLACIDPAGRPCGLDVDAEEPRPLRGLVDETWIEQARARVVRWMGLEGTALRRLSRLERVRAGLGHMDAGWELEGVRLGEARVAISVRRRGDVLLFDKRLLVPANAGAAHGRGHAQDGAILTALGVALLLGLFRPANGAHVARRARVVGLTMSAALCAVEAAALAGTTKLFAAAFGGAAALLGALALGEGRGPQRAPPPARFVRWSLFACVPLAFLGAFVGCAEHGSLFDGCTRFCTLVRVTAIPLGVLALFLSVWRDAPALQIPAIFLFGLSLLPHCICDNFANHSWIGWIGRSPMCFFPGFAAALVAMSALRGTFPRALLALLFGGAVLVGGLAVGHQLFGFPW